MNETITLIPLSYGIYHLGFISSSVKILGTTDIALVLLFAECLNLVHTKNYSSPLHCNRTHFGLMWFNLN